MAFATFVQDGAAIDYTPSSDVAAGDVVVVGDLVGVARVPIAANHLGSLALQGVFDVVKSGSSGPAFGAGDPVYFDTVNHVAVKSGLFGGVFMGTAVLAAGASDTTVRVLLRQICLADQENGLVWEDVDLSGGSKTLDAQDVDKVLNVVVGDAVNVVQLPDVAAGLSFTIRCGTTGERVAVSPNAADSISGPDFTGVDNKDRILAAVDSLDGDFVELVYGGVDGWFIRSQRGIWTSEA